VLTQPEAPEAPGAAGASIEVKDLSKRFQTRAGPVNALSPINFTIQAGEFVSVVGPSGCGKSTLMLMVAGLLKATTGEVLIDGQKLTKPLTDVGIVFQDHLLLDFRTAEKNLLLQTQIRGRPADASKKEARRLLHQLGLDAAGDLYPRQLSGGMRQRVSLARALIHDPPVLLMDEPFGALDAISRTQMRHDLESLWLEKRKTVLFITHGIEEAVGLSDRVIVMGPSPGGIVDEITVELPRPRPVEMGEERSFAQYTNRIYSIFKQLGVLKF
jgi:NitT/TauT family transport system ATP-binding protein